ncbi:MAG: NAD(P)/FAD-dependent oxidoreductase [Candidatus Rokubacteria bacterium]|nr:NAD(P)/FAD-dependent oxidoreductase [Candidatus Rokubacteria bacterium]
MSREWSYDAVVVGAGPAGSAVAILLAEHGHSVLLLDKAAFPRPKLCGEYLSPEASRILDRLGALKTVDEAGAVPLRGMRITAPDGTVLEGDYPTEGRYRGYRDHALALRRPDFDSILVARAKALPVDVRERHRVEDLLIEEDRVVGVRVVPADGRAFEIRSPLVIGADGRQSVVARRLGLVGAHALRRLALVAYVEGVGGFDGRGEIYVDPPDYAILNPVAAGIVNLSLVVPLEHAAPYAGKLDAFFLARLKQLDHLRPRLLGMRPLGPVGALGPLAYRVARPRHGGVLLVGDAAGFYDPFTGEGVYTALRSAELAAEVARRALAGGDCSANALAAFWCGRREAFRDKERLTRLLQVVIRRRWLANLVAHRLARRPDLLTLLMGVIGDSVPPRVLLFPRLLFGRPGS